MDALDDFNPLDVLAAAAAWQSANQVTNHVVESPTNHEPERPIGEKLPDPPLVEWKTTPLLDHSYAYVPRDVDNDVDDDVANVRDVAELDDVDSSVQNGHVTDSETDRTGADEQTEGQLFIVLDEDLKVRNPNLNVTNQRSCSETGVVPKSGTESVIGEVTEVSMGYEAGAGEYDTVDGGGASTPPKRSDTSGQLETNNNTKLSSPTTTTRDDSQIVPESDVKLPSLKVETSDEIDDISESCIPDRNIPVRDSTTSPDVKMSPKSDVTPKSEPTSPKNAKTTSFEPDVLKTKAAELFSVDQVVPKLSKPHELMVRRSDGLLSDKLVSPQAHDPRHTCVSIDCCSPSDISAVARDLCVDRLSSASSQDLYTEDGQESPRSLKMAVSPPGKIRRQQRGVYNIPLGPLLSDAQNRPEHPLKDHDYCLHSFYLAMTHNRIDEPVRRPGPQPKCKEQKMKRKAEKAKNKKRRSKDDFDSDLSPFKEDVFSDTDSFGLDSPSKSRMSSPTNSVASSLDLSRERIRIRDKRMNSLPSFLDKPKESMAMSNFNDNYVFFGKKPKRRNRTLVENNHDKLKKFNHSEFLPGLDISYLEARAKFHKKSEPEIKTEIPELDLTSGSELTSNPETPSQSEVNLPKGGLAFGISEEESQFIDSLHCDSHMETGFHPHEEITQEQVKELLTAVGVDNAMKLIESSTDLHRETLHEQVNSLDSTMNTLEHTGDLRLGEDYAETSAGASAEARNEDSQSLNASLNLPTTTSALSLDSKSEPLNAMTSTPTKSPARPKDLPFSPLKSAGMDLSLSEHAQIPNLGPDLGEDLATPEIHDTSLLGGTTPELHLGHVGDLNATTPDLPYGGITPHDLLDLDDTDLLNANLNLNMNMVLNFQSPDKVYHPNAGNAAPGRPIGLAQRKLDLDLGDSFTVMDKGRAYVRNNPQTMGKPEQVLKSQMFKNLSEMGQPENQDNGVPELITVNMYWNDLPGLLINGKQYVRLVDIHKQVLPAKPTGLLKNRCRALSMEIAECSELQRDFLIRYAHAAASRSQIIVMKEVAETLIGYYVDKPPVKKADDSASVADGSTYSCNADDIARLEDVMRLKRKKERRLAETKPRGRPKGASFGSSCVNITFRLAGEVFQKRVQTSGFSLLCGDSDSDSDSDVDQRITSAAARFQKILNLRAQIKAIRAEIYAIQKRQQRAEVRKAKGLARRQRSKPGGRKMVISYDPKRLPMKTGHMTTVPRSTSLLIQPSCLEKLLPTVRVAPNVDSSTRSSTSSSSVSPVPTSGGNPGTPNVIVESCTPFSIVPSAIVTPMNSRLDEPEDDDDDDSRGSTIPCVDNGLEASSYLESDDLSKTTTNDFDKTGVEGMETDDHQSTFDCSDVVLVKPGDDGSNSRRLSLPSFRSSTPSDNGKPPTRLAVQHYTGSHDCQSGYLYLNMFVSTKSSCIRCATCFQLMTVPEFLTHLHSSDDVATLIRHSIAKPRLLMIQDEQFLSSHQTALWQQFQSKNNNNGSSLSPIRSSLNKKKETFISKRRLKQNVQLSRVGRSRTVTMETNKVDKPAGERVIVKAARPSDRRSLPTSLVKQPQSADSSRYSGRVRKRKQFSPDEGYTLPKVDESKSKKSRSEALSSSAAKRSPVVRVTPLSTNSFGRPVCKVSPRPVAKISPVQAYKSPDARHRHRSGQR